MYKKIITFLILITVIISALPLCAGAAGSKAENITADTVFSGNAYGSFYFLKDKNISAYRLSAENAQITLENQNGIGGIYLIFDSAYGEYAVKNNDSGDTVTAGADGFIHEYIDLAAEFNTAPKSVTITFGKERVKLCEISVFSEGSAPDSVQVWQKPLDGGADMVLFSTHGDDEQLFFAGLLPLYAGERGYAVQVVYLTDHRNLTNVRVHEMLNGLWAVGVKAYPVMGSFADFRIDDLQKTYAKYASMGVSQDDLLEFVVTQIRRFKPQVAVCHDINGEYGHGMHRVYTDLIIKSLDVTGNSSKFSESAKKYGTWDIPKVYIHLYDQNQIVMDYDQPLSSFGGLTAFQVTQQLGFPCHQSQQATWFLGWLNSKSKAADITKYSPCQFGLYRTKVGADAKKNDMMENIVSYAQQAENERIEQERLEEEARQKELEEQKKQQEEKDNEKNKGNIIDNLDISTDNFKFELNDTTVLILAQVVFLGFILLIILIKSLFRKQ